MEPVSAIASFVALAFPVFQTCVQAFEFFNTAQHIGGQGDLFSSKLAFEQYRLLQWGMRAGLDGDSSANKRLNGTIALELLGQLESFMTSAQKLRSKYCLKVIEEDLSESAESDCTSLSQTGIAKFIARLKPSVYTTKGKIIQANSSTLKRLKWATAGKDQANAIIREIKDIISSLEQLLDVYDQDLRNRTDAILLRDIISRSTNAEEVAEIQEILEPEASKSDRAIYAAAKLKQIRLIIGADKRTDERETPHTKTTMQNTPQIIKLKPKKLGPYKINMPMHYQGTELALYNKKAVLVEWKVAEGATWKGLFDQVRCLAAMLASLDSESFRSFSCIGYLPWEERERYALVYNIPEAGPQDLQIHWEIKTLHELIVEGALTSLSRRIEIAMQVAEVMLQLHTAGWLHKSLRSENIIFLGPKGSTSQYFINQSPHLVGYEYARPDTTDAAQFSVLPDTELMTDLYRHPQARGVSRERYQKRFDMYALGCIFAELALWKPLVEIQAPCNQYDLPCMIADAARDKKTIQIPCLDDSTIVERINLSVSHHAGEAFAGVIKACVLIERSNEEVFDVDLDVQNSVLEKLRLCKC